MERGHVVQRRPISLGASPNQEFAVHASMYGKVSLRHGRRLHRASARHTYNHIIKKKTLGTVISKGKTLVLSAATETDHWKRPDFIADKLKAPLEKAVESSPEEIPPWTDEVCAKYVVYRQASLNGN